MKNYLSNENRQIRINIWENIKQLSLNQSLCEEKLQELFKYKNYNEYFYKLDKIISYMNIYKKPEPSKDKIIFYCIDALKEYEFFILLTLIKINMIEKS